MTRTNQTHKIYIVPKPVMAEHQHPVLPYLIFEERLNAKFSEIAVEFNLSGTRANLANPTNFSGNLPDSPDSTRFRKF
jgi:hypothetical protein